MVIAFCDASFSKQHQLAAGSVMITTEGREPVTKTWAFRESGNIRAELRAALRCIETCVRVFPEEPVELYSDCRALCDLPQRASQLKKQDFNNLRGEPLKNGDLYRDLLEALDSTPVTLKWIKGHTSGNRDSFAANFRLVDIAARKCLRSHYQDPKRQNGITHQNTSNHSHALQHSSSLNCSPASDPSGS